MSQVGQPATLPIMSLRSPQAPRVGPWCACLCAPDGKPAGLHHVQFPESHVDRAIWLAFDLELERQV